MKKYKKNISKIIFLIGISLLLYPMVGSLINKYLQIRQIDKYVETVNILSNEENESEYEKAVLYNEKIYERQKENKRYNLDDDYENVLNFDSTTIMGYIEIPAANIKLPIYHGVDDSVLQKGVGHVKESSLPIGTDNQNSFLMGHSGLATSKIFTNLKKVKKGDYIKITVLDKELYYLVSDIDVIKPEELIDRIPVEEGKDLVTLVTCTPYGVNSHRLVIKAERTEEIPNISNSIITKTFAKSSNILIISILLGLIPVSIVFYFIFKKLKDKGIISKLNVKENDKDSVKKNSNKKKKKKNNKKKKKKTNGKNKKKKHKNKKKK